MPKAGDDELKAAGTIVSTSRRPRRTTAPASRPLPRVIVWPHPERLTPEQHERIKRKDWTVLDELAPGSYTVLEAPRRNPARRVTDPLAYLRLLYEHSRNPLWAWLAYQTCRAADRDVPAWVSTHFDAVVTRLSRLVTDDAVPATKAGTVKGPRRSNMLDWRTRLLEAFGLDAPPRRGQTTRYADYLREVRDVELATRVRLLVDGESIGVHKACDSVAHELGLDVSLVRRAWRKFGATVRTVSMKTQSARLREGQSPPLTFKVRRRQGLSVSRKQ
jgi:hypothetical protein